MRVVIDKLLVMAFEAPTQKTQLELEAQQPQNAGLLTNIDMDDKDLAETISETMQGADKALKEVIKKRYVYF